jgi:hypothetical protein
MEPDIRYARNDGVDRIHDLRPRRVYLAHAAEPWNPVVD